MRNDVTQFEVMQKHYKQRDLAAREWKAKGGKVAGYFCDKVPEEMILAAGFFPLRLSGDPWHSTEAADKYTEPFYEGFVRSMFSMLLAGQYDFLDFLIIPHSRDSILGLYAILQEVQGFDPDLELPELYLFETLHTRFYLTGLYNRDRVRDLKKKLERWSGKEISNESISQAIAVVNENKALLKKAAELRATEPPHLSGTEALQIIGSSIFMLKDEHNKLLTRFLEEADKLPERDGMRLFVTGSPMDNLQFYELVESCNAVIVGEDSCWGKRYADDPVATSLDPLEAIADRYHLKSPCPWMYPMALRPKYCLQKSLEAKAQGAVFFIDEWDYAQAWDYPDLKEALEANGIPTVCFKKQKYLLSDSERERLKIGIEDFIKKIEAGVT
ncbi:2-hydroxyacyl-CoA dehydratase subunit D [Thermodesulfobacteriota bacterium]